MAEANPKLEIPLEKEDQPVVDINPERYEMLPLPSSMDKHFLPSDIDSEKKHIGFDMMSRSMKAQRANNQATIFIYGKSGDGKSTTLNYLFDSAIIPTSDHRSETRVVTEYGCSMTSPYWNVSGLRIGFIDTPGFDDTQGKDTENLAKISHFIETHPKLGNYSKSSRTYPNIVLIVVSALDKRMIGMESRFSKMLHVLTKLNVVDCTYPNVVIVVTNAMHFAKEDFKKETKKIVMNCNLMARAHFSMKVPVVFIENIDTRNEMEHEGDWRILPDGTRQPLNLFNVMMKLMSQSGDEVGVEAVRLFFSEARQFQVDVILSNPSHLNNSVSWMKVMQETLFPTQNEIYSLLSQQLRSDDSEILPLVCNLKRINLVKPAQLQNKDLTEIRKEIFPFILTKEEIDLLIHLFQIARINRKLDFKLLGLGYSEEFKKERQRILDVSPGINLTGRDYDVLVPDGCIMKDVGKFAIKVTCNVNATWWLLRYLKLTFRISFISLQVDIDKLAVFSLNEKFLNALREALPEGVPINLHYKLENPKFARFVQNYGLTCCTGLNFGGLIEGEIYFNRKSDPEASKAFLDDKRTQLIYLLETWIKSIQNGKILTLDTVPPQIDKIFFRKLCKTRLTWKGGDKKYNCRTLTNLSVNAWNNWVDSIQENTVCLENITRRSSLATILSSSPQENIRSYAEHFSDTPTAEQTGLDDQCLLNPVDDSAEGLGLDTCETSQLNFVLTRAQARHHSRALCVIS